MKTRIAALLMSLAMSINGGPIEVEETEPAIIPEEVITETVLTQQIIPEDIVEETIITEELEGEPLKAELSEMSERRDGSRQGKRSIRGCRAGHGKDR